MGAARSLKIESVRDELLDMAVLKAVHAQKIHKLNKFTQKMTKKADEFYNLANNLIAR